MLVGNDNIFFVQILWLLIKWFPFRNSDNNECQECEDVLRELENIGKTKVKKVFLIEFKFWISSDFWLITWSHNLAIPDDEASDLQIMFVKIRDLRYAKKYGIVSMPSLVFFRRKFPSLYRGEWRLSRLVLPTWYLFDPETCLWIEQFEFSIAFWVVIRFAISSYYSNWYPSRHSNCYFKFLYLHVKLIRISLSSPTIRRS